MVEQKQFIGEQRNRADASNAQNVMQCKKNWNAHSAIARPGRRKQKGRCGPCVKGRFEGTGSIMKRPV